MEFDDVLRNDRKEQLSIKFTLWCTSHGRPYCFGNVFMVFRFQRKALYVSFGFFFPVIIC